MNIFLNNDSFCPECGFCNYEVIEKSTNTSYKLAVGRCDEHTCDYSIYDVHTNRLIDSYQVNDLTALKNQVHERFNLTKREDCNCG